MAQTNKRARMFKGKKSPTYQCALKTEFSYQISLMQIFNKISQDVKKLCAFEAAITFLMKTAIFVS